MVESGLNLSLELADFGTESTVGTIGANAGGPVWNDVSEEY